MDTREVETGVPNRRPSPKFVVTNGTNYNDNDAVKTNKNKNRRGNRSKKSTNRKSVSSANSVSSSETFHSPYYASIADGSIDKKKGNKKNSHKGGRNKNKRPPVTARTSQPFIIGGKTATPIQLPDGQWATIVKPNQHPYHYESTTATNTATTASASTLLTPHSERKLTLPLQHVVTEFDDQSSLSSLGTKVTLNTQEMQAFMSIAENHVIHSDSADEKISNEDNLITNATKTNASGKLANEYGDSADPKKDTLSNIRESTEDLIESINRNESFEKKSNTSNLIDFPDTMIETSQNSYQETNCVSFEDVDESNSCDPRKDLNISKDENRATKIKAQGPTKIIDENKNEIGSQEKRTLNISEVSEDLNKSKDEKHLEQASNTDNNEGNNEINFHPKQKLKLKLDTKHQKCEENSFITKTSISDKHVSNMVPKTNVYENSLDAFEDAGIFFSTQDSPFANSRNAFVPSDVDDHDEKKPMDCFNICACVIQ